MRGSFPPDAERVCDAIDVIEPRGDERDLQYGFVVKTDRAQAHVVVSRNSCGIFSELHHVIQHRTFLCADRGLAMVFAQCLNQCFIQCDPAQKLCVRFQSILAAVRDGDHGGDHFMLPSREGKFGRHQRTESGKGVTERLGNEAM